MKRGSAHVKGLYTYPSGSGTQVIDGAARIGLLGLPVIKVYLTSAYVADYPLETWSSTPTSLTTLVQTSEMAAIFSGNWDTIILTCFTFANGNTNWWRVDPSAARMQAEYTELYNLCIYLLTTYPSKNFIIQNWEGDWAFMDSTNVNTDVSELMISRYTAFLGVRQRAINDARSAVTGSIKHAIEVNRVCDARLYAHRRRLLTNLAKRLTPDLISYSAYDSTIVDQGGWGSSYADWKSNTLPLFRKAISAIKIAWPGVPVYIGEWGLPEQEKPVGLSDQEFKQMVVDIDAVALEENLKYFIYWQVFDNEQGIGGPGTYRGYWLTKPDGSNSLAWSALQVIQSS